MSNLLYHFVVINSNVDPYRVLTSYYSHECSFHMIHVTCTSMYFYLDVELLMLYGSRMIISFSHAEGLVLCLFVLMILKWSTLT